MRALTALAGLALVAALAGCSDDGGSSSGDDTSNAGESSSCAELSGKPVEATTTCGDFDAPASSGCYVDGARDGNLYYFIGDAETVYGKDGGDWEVGPADMSVSDMASEVGC